MSYGLLLKAYLNNRLNLKLTRTVNQSHFVLFFQMPPIDTLIKFNLNFNFLLHKKRNLENFQNFLKNNYEKL